MARLVSLLATAVLFLSGAGVVAGFFYMQFTGVVTKDRDRVARHVDCNATTSDCTVVWTLNGQAIRAKFLYQVDDGHPVFLVERADIVQPGAFSHFHWLDDMAAAGAFADGYLLQLTAEDKFCFIPPVCEREPPRDRGLTTRVVMWPDR